MGNVGTGGCIREGFFVCVLLESRTGDIVFCLVVVFNRGNGTMKQVQKTHDMGETEENENPMKRK